MGIHARRLDGGEGATFDTAFMRREPDRQTVIKLDGRYNDHADPLALALGVRKADQPFSLEQIRAWFKKRFANATLPAGSQDALAVKLFSIMTPAERQAEIEATADAFPSSPVDSSGRSMTQNPAAELVAVVDRGRTEFKRDNLDTSRESADSWYDRQVQRRVVVKDDAADAIASSAELRGDQKFTISKAERFPRALAARDAAARAAR